MSAGLSSSVICRYGLRSKTNVQDRTHTCGREFRAARILRHKRVFNRGIIRDAIFIRQKENQDAHTGAHSTPTLHNRVTHQDSIADALKACEGTRSLGDHPPWSNMFIVTLLRFLRCTIPENGPSHRHEVLHR